MATYYYVSQLANRLTREPYDPYPEAVLSAIQYEQSISEHILIAAIHHPRANTERYYKQGFNGEFAEDGSYPEGLPAVGFLNAFQYDEIALLNQVSLDSGFLAAGITIDEVKSVRGNELSLGDVAKYEFSNRANYEGRPISHQPIGLVEDGIDNDPAEMHINVAGHPDKRIGAELNDIWVSEFYLFDLLEDDLINQNNMMPDYYTYQVWEGKVTQKFDVLNDAYNDQEKDNLVETRDTNGLLTKPADNDWLFVVKWHAFAYEKENRYYIYNVTENNYPSGLGEPTFPPSIEVYPIIQIRKNLEWYEDYLAPSDKRDYDYTFEQLGFGTLEMLTDQLKQSGSLADIDDAFITLGSDLYTLNNYDNEYNFYFWKNIIVKGSNSINNDNSYYDVNFINIIEGDFNQGLSFRKCILEDILDPLTVSTTTEWEFSHRWEVEPGLEEIVAAPWVWHWVAQVDDTPGTYERIPQAEVEALSSSFLRMEYISNHIYIIEQIHPNGTVFQRISITGIQQHHRLFFDATATNKWAYSIANPDDEALRVAQEAYDDAVAAQKQQAISDGVDYVPGPEFTGDQASSFVIPLLRDEIMSTEYLRMRGRAVDHILGTCPYIQFYGSKIHKVAWWKEVLSFVLEAFELLSFAYSIFTMGVNIFIAITQYGLRYLIQEIGMDFLKKAIVKILVKEIGQEVRIVEMLYNLYEGDWGDFDIHDIAGTVDFEMMYELVNAVIQMKLMMDMSKLADQAYELDISEADIEEINDEVDLYDKTRGSVDASPEYKSVILFEKPTEFISRTMNTNVATIVGNRLRQYGKPPNADPKYSFTEDNELGSIVNEMTDNFNFDEIDFNKR